MLKFSNIIHEKRFFLLALGYSDDFLGVIRLSCTFQSIINLPTCYRQMKTPKPEVPFVCLKTPSLVADRCGDAVHL